jgi:UDP-glucose 4-epimerase
MKILLTGASSFTGSWFASTLAKSGHQVYGTLQSEEAVYSAGQHARFAFMRKAGVELLESHAFGGDAFLAALGDAVDVLCLHGAYVRDYKSPDFDIIGAVNANTHNLAQVVRTAKDNGIGRLIATGSVFEDGEGAGEPPLKAASPYGLSKSLTWTLVRAYCERVKLPVAKFVIPNPFGPYEEPRFCAYLMKCWAENRTAHVNTPAYIRDNIPINLLAVSYADLVARSRESDPMLYAHPSGFIESQGSFAQRFANAIGPRLGLETPLHFAPQIEFCEPRMRVNTDRVLADWDELGFWNDLAAYYKTVYLQA